MSRTLTKRLEYVEKYEPLTGADLGEQKSVAALSPKEQFKSDPHYLARYKKLHNIVD